EERARAADSGLDLVQHEQDLLFVAPGADALEVVAGRNIDAAFALNDLEQNGAGLRRRCLLERIDVVVGYGDEARRQRRERNLVAIRPGRGHSGKRAAMERIERRNDLEGAVLPLAAPLPRQFDRGFVRFGAAVDEVDAVHAGVLNK